jgi:uncharacterized membrane protein
MSGKRPCAGRTTSSPCAGVTRRPIRFALALRRTVYCTSRPAKKMVCGLVLVSGMAIWILGDKVGCDSPRESVWIVVFGTV